VPLIFLQSTRISRFDGSIIIQNPTPTPTKTFDLTSKPPKHPNYSFGTYETIFSYRFFGGHSCFSSGHLIMSSTRHSLFPRGATKQPFSALHIYIQNNVPSARKSTILTTIYRDISITYPGASSLLNVLISLHSGLYNLLSLAAMTFAVPYYSTQGPPFAHHFLTSVSSDDTRERNAFVWPSK